MSIDAVVDDAKIVQDCRSKRLKTLRKMTEMSRRCFAEKYNISQGTLQNWETSRFGGLTEKGARRMLKSLQSEGVFCSFEWLMYGFGDQPKVQSVLENKSSASPLDHPSDLSIEDELRYMSQLHASSIYMIVNDESMAPEYNRGDYVFGVKYTGGDMAAVVRQVCIVEMMDASKVLRYVRPSGTPCRYDLIATKPVASKNPIEMGVEVVSLAPVMWIRSPNIVN
jgi:hypothetical protein